MMPLLVHLVACTWIYLGSGTAGPDPDQSLEYIKAIYWSFTTLTTVGYGDISAKTPAQMLFACCVQVLGVGVFGFVLSNVASLLSRMDAAREHHMDSLDKIETFMRSHEIGADLRVKIRDYYHYLWTNHRGYRDTTLLQDLPKKMQSELFLFINRSIIERVPMLRDASVELIEDLMNELKPRILVPGERIFRAGDPGDAMYFIQNGQVEILSTENKLIAELKDGDYFGEMALVSEKPRSASARAASFCDIYVLSKAAFSRAINTYPEFSAHLEKTVKERQSTPVAPKRAS
jgi:voltage-gated potassium channel